MSVEGQAVVGAIAVNVTRSTFTRNAAAGGGGGGAIRLQDVVRFVASDCMFDSNTAFSTKVTRAAGGAVAIVGTDGEASVLNVVFVNSTFHACAADRLGGAIWAESTSTTTLALTVLGGSFERSTTTDAGGGGGALCVSGAAILGDIVVTVRDTVFRNNSCTSGTGGAALVTYSVSVLRVNCSAGIGIEQVSGEGDGGGLAGTPLKLLFAGVRFEGNAASSGGAVAVDGAVLGMWDGCVLDGNVATVGAGGAFSLANRAQVTLQASRCTFNSAKTGGGCMAAQEQVSITLTGQSITMGNRAEDWAAGGMASLDAASGLIDLGSEHSNNTAGHGGVYACGISSFVSASNCQFVDNAARSNGGVLDTSSSTSQAMINCVAEGNSAGGVGGVIHAGEQSHVVVTGATVLHRNRAGRGGAIAGTDGAQVSLVGTTLEGNTATSDGGHCYAGSGFVLLATSASWEGGVAGASGGAVAFADESSATLTLNTFVGNSAQTGGAISTAQVARVALIQPVVQGNAATLGPGGGIVVTDDSSITLTRGSVTGNAAATDGGAAAITGHGGRLQGSFTSFFRNTAAQDGGALAVVDGSVTLTRANVTGNSCTGDGGAIMVASGATAQLQSCTGLANAAARGGFLATTTAGDAMVQSSTLAHNTAQWGGAVHIQGPLPIAQQSGSVVVASGTGSAASNREWVTGTSVLRSNQASAGGGALFWTVERPDKAEFIVAPSHAATGTHCHHRRISSLTLTLTFVHRQRLPKPEQL